MTHRLSLSLLLLFLSLSLSRLACACNFSRARKSVASCIAANLHEPRMVYCLGKRMHVSSTIFPLPSPFPARLFSRGTTTGRVSQWRLILAVDYQFSTNLAPLVAAPAFVPANHPLAPAFTPRCVHPIRFAYYDAIYLRAIVRASRRISRNVTFLSPFPSFQSSITEKPMMEAYLSRPSSNNYFRLFYKFSNYKLDLSVKAFGIVEVKERARSIQIEAAVRFLSRTFPSSQLHSLNRSREFRFRNAAIRRRHRRNLQTASGRAAPSPRSEERRCNFFAN